MVCSTGIASANAAQGDQGGQRDHIGDALVAQSHRGFAEGHLPDLVLALGHPVDASRVGEDQTVLANQPFRNADGGLVEHDQQRTLAKTTDAGVGCPQMAESGPELPCRMESAFLRIAAIRHCGI